MGWRLGFVHALIVKQKHQIMMGRLTSVKERQGRYNVLHIIARRTPMTDQPSIHSVVSLLDSKHYELVKSIWQMLGKNCGLRGISITPFPHFSWQAALGYPEPVTETTVKTIANQLRPFKIQTAGLGFFTGRRPVLYIAVVKTEELAQVHKYIWQQVAKIADEPTPYYAPENWMPHITLAWGDVNVESLACAMQLLASNTFDWQLEVNNLAVIGQLPEQTGKLQYRYRFA
ncbi:MAG: 2'-5' RNA ligase family protein [Chloroflexi bacterium]|nr:MAG: 2'-5' RNA ligase family protein [Chloroflexota bacterium]